MCSSLPARAMVGGPVLEGKELARRAEIARATPDVAETSVACLTGNVVSPTECDSFATATARDSVLEHVSGNGGSVTGCWGCRAGTSDSGHADGINHATEMRVDVRSKRRRIHVKSSPHLFGYG